MSTTGNPNGYPPGPGAAQSGDDSGRAGAGGGAYEPAGGAPGAPGPVDQGGATGYGDYDAPVVLAVNDDPDACELLARILTRSGFAVGLSYEAHDAFEQIVELSPDCVLLDLASGGVGPNLKILDRIRRASDPAVALTRVVLVSREPNSRLFCWQAGIDAFLTRPFHMHELVAMVQDVVERPEVQRGPYRQAQADHARAGGPIPPKQWENA
jgi:CheY-like chemotaxis protein